MRRRPASEEFRFRGKAVPAQSRGDRIARIGRSGATTRNVHSAADVGEATASTLGVVRGGLEGQQLDLARLSIEIGDGQQAMTYLRDGVEVAHDLGSGYLLPGALTEAGRLLVLLGRTDVGLALIFAGEHQYELAGLTPDPGDDAFQEQRAAAIAALPDARVGELMAMGVAMPLDEAVALTRTELRAERPGFGEN